MEDFDESGLGEEFVGAGFDGFAGERDGLFVVACSREGAGERVFADVGGVFEFVEFGEGFGEFSGGEEVVATEFGEGVFDVGKELGFFEKCVGHGLGDLFVGFLVGAGFGFGGIGGGVAVGPFFGEELFEGGEMTLGVLGSGLIEGGECEGAEALDFVLGIVGEGLERVGIFTGGDFGPHLKLDECLTETFATVGGRSAAFGGGVVFGMAGDIEHVLSEFNGAAGVAEENQIADEPFVVVGVVVNLSGEDAVAEHVGVIDAGGGFLLPDGVGIAVEFGIGMSGHVPHVGNAGRGLAVEGG